MTLSKPTPAELAALARRCRTCNAGVGVWCWDGRSRKVSRPSRVALHVARSKP